MDAIERRGTSYGGATVVALSVYFFKYLPVSNWIILTIQIVVGVGVFFTLCETKKLPEYMEVKEIAKNYLRIVFHKS